MRSPLHLYLYESVFAIVSKLMCALDGTHFISLNRFIFLIADTLFTSPIKV